MYINIFIYIHIYPFIYLSSSVSHFSFLATRSLYLSLLWSVIQEHAFERRLPNGGHSPQMSVTFNPRNLTLSHENSPPLKRYPSSAQLERKSARVMKKQPNIKLYLSCTCCPYRWPNTISCYGICRQRVDQTFFHCNSIQFKVFIVTQILYIQDTQRKASYLDIQSVHSRHWGS